MEILSPICIILTWWQIVGDDIGCEVSLQSLKIGKWNKNHKGHYFGQHGTITGLTSKWKLPFQSRPERSFPALRHQTSGRFASNSWCWWRSLEWWTECSGCIQGLKRQTPSCSYRRNSCQPRNYFISLRVQILIFNFL